ncbi:MAG: EAL domain-containing protein [Oscillospiraceae bacterium]|nr:EAL domain-containing protein [Oscillospiraceae bacterium]
MKRDILLVAAVVLSLLLGLGLSFLYTYHHTESTAVERAHEVLSDGAREQAATVSAALEGQLQALRAIAITLEDSSRIPEHLAALSAEVPFHSIELFSPDGELLCYGGERVGLPIRPEYFSRVLRGEHIAASYFSEEEGRRVVFLSVPFHAGAAVTGVLRGCYYEESIHDILNAEAYGGDSFSLLCDSEGNIILSEDGLQNEFGGLTLREIIASSEFSGQDYDLAVSALLSGESPALSFSYAGKSYIGACTPLSGSYLGSSGWLVFNIVGSERLASEVAAARSSIAVSLWIIIFFSLAAIGIFAVYVRESRARSNRDYAALKLREEEFKIVARQSNRYVCVYDIQTMAIQRDSNLNDGFGPYGGPLTFQDVLRRGFVLPESADTFRGFAGRISRGESPVTADVLMKRIDDMPRWYRFEATTLFDSKGLPESAVISYFDCTELREREAAYARWQQELKGYSGESYTCSEYNLTLNVFERDFGPKRTDYSKAEDSGFDSHIALYAQTCVAASDRENFLSSVSREKLLGAFYNGTDSRSFDYLALGPQGEEYWSNIKIQLVRYPESDDIKCYILVKNIDEEKRRELALINRSQRDSLTGVYNRATFIGKVEQILADEPDTTHAILLLDADGFKHVNDTLGHDAGDKLLADFAASIRSSLRQSDLIGRIGGDEFMVFLSNIPYDSVIERKAQQLCFALRKRLDENISVSASIGVAVYPRDGTEFEELYRRADEALYYVKRSSKGGYRLYDNSLLDTPGSEAVQAEAEEECSGLLIISSKQSFCDEVRALVKGNYEILCATERHHLSEILSTRGFYISAAVLDADCELAETALNMLKPRLDDFRILIYALRSLATESETVRLIELGASYVARKPVNEALLNLRLDFWARVRDYEKYRLQADYRRLQGEQERRYREALNATGASVLVYDAQTGSYQVEHMSPGGIAGSFDGRPLLRVLEEDGVVTPEELSETRAALHAIGSGEQRQGSSTLRLTTRTGEKHWFNLRMLRLEGEDSQTPKVLIIITDINNSIQADEALRFRAEHDPLTGLYNRTTFFKKAAEIIALKEPGYYAITRTDINKFKYINDQYGSSAGDKVLKTIANIIGEYCRREGGVCSRITADIFVALFPASFLDSNDFITMNEAMKRAYHASVPLTLTIGVYRIRDKRLSVSAMFDRASLAATSIKGLYDRNIAEYDESMRRDLLETQEIVSGAERALREQRFELWLQPQINHSTGALIGAEALVRWRKRDGSLLPPARFIPVFESNRFIYKLDKYIWNKACELLRRWLDESGRAVSIAVNISRIDLLEENFFETITGLIKHYDLPPKLLRLEITESAFSYSPKISEMVDRLRAEGFDVEIDDFGSGYSSLNTLKEVNASTLKLDMSFLRRGYDKARGGNIISSVVRMAKWLGMPVIAEGVETKQQADFLKSIGCSYVQGYLYGAPMPADEFEKLFGGAEIENRLQAMQPTVPLNNNAFWNPDSVETLIFNSYVGGAGIFECDGGEIELLRLNDKGARALGEESIEAALKLSPKSCLGERAYAELLDCMNRASESAKELTCELKAETNSGTRYLFLSLREIAQMGSRRIYYCLINDLTKHRETEAKLTEDAQRLRDMLDKLEGENSET